MNLGLCFRTVLVCRRLRDPRSVSGSADVVAVWYQVRLVAGCEGRPVRGEKIPEVFQRGEVGHGGVVGCLVDVGGESVEERGQCW